MGNESYENRDMRCAADVGRMAELGRFDVQFDVYGSAVQESEGKIYYWATSKEDKLYDCIQQKRLEEKYFTPIVCQSRRTKVPAGMKEQLLQETKYALLRQLKRDYEDSDYFALMQPFFQMTANDEALPILESYQEHVDGHFDDTELQLFLGAAWIAYEAKVLSCSSYKQLLQWHNTVRQQMADDPVVADNLERTFYGFIYQKADGSNACVIDAQRMMVVHRRQEKLLQGLLVGPIMQKKYWFQSFQQLEEIRKNYQRWLLQGQNENYFHILWAIHCSKSIIEYAALQSIKEKLKDNKRASQAVSYYQALWNCC